MQHKNEKRPGKQSLAGSYVHKKIGQLVEGDNDSLTRASLARLRRGIGKPPGSLPDLWAMTLDGMPQELVGTGREPSWGEWACYLTLTLFALHQQGKDWKTEPMSQKGWPLGRAVRRLATDDDSLARVKRRFDQMVTADSPQEAAHYLRSIVQLLRAEGIPLDYPALAQDLYSYQNPQFRDGVRLKWGRDFCFVPLEKKDETPDEEQLSMTEIEEETHEEV